MRQQTVSWGVSAQTWIRESAQLLDSGVVCRRWMQEYTMSQWCSIGFRIALMPSSPISYWHTPATWDLQQEELRPTAPGSGLTVGLLPGKPLRAADTVSCCHESRKCNASQNGMKLLFSRGCLSSLPMDCPIGKTACQTDILLLPNWTGWCPWSVVDLDLYFDDSVLPLLFCAV